MAILMLFGGEGICQDGIKVACVGNSITQGPGRSHPESYPMQLQEILGEEYLVKNFGVSGSTLLKSGDKPYWEEPQFEMSKNFDADILILKLGTNDTKPQNWKFHEDFKKDYIDLVETFKASMKETSQLYICFPVPIFQDNWGITSSILENEIIPILKEVAEITGVLTIDLHKEMSEKSSLFPDGIHPDKEGNRVMAEKISSHILKKHL